MKMDVIYCHPFLLEALWKCCFYPIEILCVSISILIVSIWQENVKAKFMRAKILVHSSSINMVCCFLEHISNSLDILMIIWCSKLDIHYGYNVNMVEIYPSSEATHNSSCWKIQQVFWCNLFWISKNDSFYIMISL